MIKPPSSRDADRQGARILAEAIDYARQGQLTLRPPAPTAK